MRSKKKSRYVKHHVLVSGSDHKRALTDRAATQISKLEKIHADSKCILAIDRAVIDSFMLHFKVDSVDAINLLLKHIAGAKRSKFKKIYGIDTFSQIKIRNKPIVLWVTKSNNWRSEKYRIVVSLKPNFMVTSVESVVNDITDKAISDALGV